MAFGGKIPSKARAHDLGRALLGRIRQLALRLPRLSGYPAHTSYSRLPIARMAKQALHAYRIQELGRMATNAVVSMLIVYSMVCLSFLNFHKRCPCFVFASSIQEIADYM